MFKLSWAVFVNHSKRPSLRTNWPMSTTPRHHREWRKISEQSVNQHVPWLGTGSHGKKKSGREQMNTCWEIVSQI